MTKIIDGRKAEIVHPGQRWTSYQALANSLGYPDAAIEYGKDRRKYPSAGETVTVLSATDSLGQPVTHDGNRVYIVECTNGDRHIFSEKGLRILDADSAPITVLPDESLGGVSREYREVKRKASVGETIHVFGHCDQRANGVFTVDSVIDCRDGYGDTYYYTVDGGSRYGTPYYNGKAYVVLEPTEILRIDDKDGVNRAYRMVDRKAAGGERVIIVDDREGTGGMDGIYFRVGNVATSLGSAGFNFNGNPYVRGNGRWGVRAGAYRVLEPLTSAELAPNPTPLSALPIADQYAENITVLTRKIAQLEKRNTALESRILALETDSSPSYVKVASGPVDNTLPTFSKAPKSAQQIRDEIVERAKADISNPHKFAGTPIAREELRFWPRGSGIVTHTVEYVVSSDKRTVVALVIETYGGRKIVARGIAKCAPGETFNAHIGRAIALYRALGLEVPTEYLTCPQPEEVRVGDVVLWTNSYDAADTQVFTIASVLSEGYRFVGGEWDGFETVRVIDDSREDDGISAASSALKGAA
ncbi:hypothetical protein [Paenibacillus odorifer]|uniref:Uncharacterized protein n=1 Tax=Paenibacillus odorifer TaxID=189426 RepID=A0A1R0X2Z1_9BACL|nr:hypothetical protein [Paenibacillus odorifer]OMD27479.1 hypothetical protein BJP51_25115 [Paenibacillus odorifer]